MKSIFWSPHNTISHVWHWRWSEFTQWGFTEIQHGRGQSRHSPSLTFYRIKWQVTLTGESSSYWCNRLTEQHQVHGSLQCQPHLPFSSMFQFENFMNKRNVHELLISKSYIRWYIWIVIAYKKIVFFSLFNDIIISKDIWLDRFK